MTFRVGQMVVCIDASLPANPWHRAHPLVLKKIYVVQHCFQECIDIDGSRRGWQNWRFRPLVERSTDIGFAILKKLEISNSTPIKKRDRLEPIFYDVADAAREWERISCIYGSLVKRARQGKL